MYIGVGATGVQASLRCHEECDACACAIAARDSIDRLPRAPLTDARGLKMTVSY